MKPNVEIHVLFSNLTHYEFIFVQNKKKHEKNKRDYTIESNM